MILFLLSACTDKEFKEKQNNDTNSVKKENRVFSDTVDNHSNEIKESIHTTFINSKTKKDLLQHFDFYSGDYTLIGLESNHPATLSHLVGGNKQVYE